MSPQAAAVVPAADLQVNEATGTFTVVLSFKDKNGFKAKVPAGLSASYVASDATPGPSLLVLAPSADQSTAAGSIDQAAAQALLANGGTLPTGLTITVTVSAGLEGQTAPVTAVADPPIDVVAGPAATFVAAESTP